MHGSPRIQKVNVRMTRKPTVAIDFDGTLVYGEDPVPGAKLAIDELRAAGYRILIHSCNTYDWIQRILRENDIYYDCIWEEDGKPPADWYIDDRAISFRGSWVDVLQEIEYADAGTKTREE